MPLLEHPINVVMLGLSGAGKTSYMASANACCYDETQAFSGFTVKAASQHVHNKLLGIANGISNNVWPRGTDVCNEYKFNLVHNGSTIAQFNWSDYRGGALISDDGRETATLFASMKSADAIMVFIDGEKFYTASRVRIRAELGRLMNLVNHCISERNDYAVIVLAMTKCDLDISDDDDRINDLAPFFESINASQKMQGIFTRVSCVTGENLEFPVLACAALPVRYKFADAAKKLADINEQADRLADEINRHCDNDWIGNRLWSVVTGEKSECEMAESKFNEFNRKREIMEDIILKLKSIEPSVDAISDYLKKADETERIFMF